jgi:hypothetical protein
MAALELVDHTQDLQCWRLPQQQHGARQPLALRKAKSDEDTDAERPKAPEENLSGE